MPDYKTNGQEYPLKPWEKYALHVLQRERVRPSEPIYISSDGRTFCDRLLDNASIIREMAEAMTRTRAKEQSSQTSPAP